MKTILVPTDFSDNSRKAFSYALQLAVALDAKILVMHAFHFKAGGTFMPVAEINALEEQTRQEAKEKLAIFIADVLKDNELDDNKDLIIETSVRLGFAVEEAIAITEAKPIYMIVMGTRGAGNATQRFLGTNATAIMNNVNCPVLVIPEVAKFKGIKKIVYATDLSSDKDIKEQVKLIDIARIFSAEILFLHISKSNHLSETDKQSRFNAIRQSIDYDKCNFYDLQHDEIEVGLKNFALYHEADMLAMATRQRTFFQKIFNPSLTTDMAFDAQLPLMVLHA